MRVFVTHNPEDFAAYFGRAIIGLEPIAEVVRNPLERDLTTSELLEASAGCDVVVAHRSTPGEAEFFAEHGDVLAFLRCAVDISTIDVAAASEAEVLVARADKSFVPSTAELALGLLLDCARNISASTHDYRMGSEPPQRSGWQLAGQTAAILGYGAIGSYLSGLLLSLGMRVVVYDPHVSVGAAAVTEMPLRQALAEADAVFPLAQASPDTENMIDREALAMMKPGATLINVSRGELLDDDAVLAALDSGQLAAVGLDVGRAADQRPASQLASHPRVVATPHLGGLTPQNADAQAQSAVDQVAAMLAGDMPARAVNPERAGRLRRWWAP